MSKIIMKLKNRRKPKNVQEIFEMSNTLNLNEEERLFWIADNASKLADKGDIEANELMTELFQNIISEAETNPTIPKEEVDFLKSIILAGANPDDD